MIIRSKASSNQRPVLFQRFASSQNHRTRLFHNKGSFKRQFKTIHFPFESIVETSPAEATQNRLFTPLSFVQSRRADFAPGMRRCFDRCLGSNKGYGRHLPISFCIYIFSLFIFFLLKILILIFVFRFRFI